MRYADIIYNDFTAGDGVSLTFLCRAAPFAVKVATIQNYKVLEEVISFDGEVLNNIIKGLTANGIQRNLCIMGGEPLCEENKF